MLFSHTCCFWPFSKHFLRGFIEDLYQWFWCGSVQHPHTSCKDLILLKALFAILLSIFLTHIVNLIKAEHNRDMFNCGFYLCKDTGSNSHWYWAALKNEEFSAWPGILLNAKQRTVFSFVEYLDVHERITGSISTFNLWTNVRQYMK